MKINKKKKGFTLIELIVVIAILGILAAIMVPRFSGFQANANKKAITGNLKTLDTACATYAASHDVAETDATVTSANLISEGLISALPSGPAGTTYTVVAGVSTAIVPTGGISGIPAGSYHLGDEAIQ